MPAAGSAAARVHEAAQRLDRIGLGSRLVRPLARDAGKAQRHFAGVAGTALNAVEPHFNHRLGADEDGAVAPAAVDSPWR